ncbi:RNase III [Gammaproteobacteria bacterium]
MNFEFKSLEKAIGYSFEDRGLLELALTHRSAHGVHNERLEFLGDAALGYFVAEILYHRFPDAKEGELTRMRAFLVRGDSLFRIAQSLHLNQHLWLGTGEVHNKKSSPSSILEDALESLIGAVYLDGGQVACQALVLRLLEPLLNNLPTSQDLKDCKTRLQELLQAQHLTLPVYRVCSISGTEQEKVFHVECYLSDTHKSFDGVGSSRRIAEQEAARRALTYLETLHIPLSDP